MGAPFLLTTVRNVAYLLAAHETGMASSRVPV
jgi:hypothetical protein